MFIPIKKLCLLAICFCFQFNSALFARPTDTLVLASGNTITSTVTARQPLAAATWYVAPGGNDAGSGTLTSPFKTISKAVATAVAGDTIYIRGGTHVYNTPVSITKSGNTTASYFLFAFPGEKPVLSFAGMAVAGSNRGMNLSGSYWHIKGLDFFKAGDNGMFISGSNNLIEQCNFYENSDTGLQLGGGAAHNRIVNCDSYFNADPSHGNADGFAPKLDVGTGNYFYGCRAWQNSDDGWDGYMRGGNDVTTTLENCWVFKSGYLKNGNTSSGNGNGFKMGGSDDRSLQHNTILINCLAFDNRDKGFDQNNNRGSMTIYNGTAFNNGRNYAISLAVATGKSVIVANSISAGTGTVSLGSFVVQLTNSWMSGFSATAADFVSTNAAEAYGPRKPDGSLPDISFMHLRPESDLIDRGTYVGLPFKGAAPDLGCFEYDSTPLSAAAAVNSSGQLSLQVSPTPSSGSSFIRFSTSCTGPAAVKVLDATGRLVAEVHEGAVIAGKSYTIPFQAGALTDGLYFVVLENCSEKTTTRMLLAR